MLRIHHNRTIIAIVFFLCFPALMLAAGDAGLSSENNNRHEFIKISQAATKEDAPRPALSVTPREIDFGDIGPENVANTLIEEYGQRQRRLVYRRSGRMGGGGK
jgi:hypothetical protein